MNKRNAASLILALTISLPVTATIISGDVTGGTAQAAGGTFVKLSVPLFWPTPVSTI
jgi:hypothetical protein